MNAAAFLFESYLEDGKRLMRHLREGFGVEVDVRKDLAAKTIKKNVEAQLVCWLGHLKWASWW